MPICSIIQDYQTDCGPASVAMLCSISLAEASKYIYHGRRRGLTSSGKLLNAIQKFGRTPLANKCQMRGQVDLAKLGHDALLKGIMRDGEKSWIHWAVWDREAQCIRDPYGYWYPFQVTHLIEVD